LRNGVLFQQCSGQDEAAFHDAPVAEYFNLDSGDPDAIRRKIIELAKNSRWT